MVLFYPMLKRYSFRLGIVLVLARLLIYSAKFSGSMKLPLNKSHFMH